MGRGGALLSSQQRSTNPTRRPQSQATRAPLHPRPPHGHSLATVTARPQPSHCHRQATATARPLPPPGHCHRQATASYAVLQPVRFRLATQRFLWRRWQHFFLTVGPCCCAVTFDHLDNCTRYLARLNQRHPSHCLNPDPHTTSLAAGDILRRNSKDNCRPSTNLQPSSLSSSPRPSAQALDPRLKP